MKKNALQIKFAKSLYKHAADEKIAEKYFQQLNELAALAADKKLLESLNALSFVGMDKIHHVLSELFGKHFSPAVLNMMTLLVANREVKLLPHIARIFQKTYFDATGIKDVLICSSRELSEKESDELSKKLNAKNKSHLTFKVDKTLIGGIQIYENGKLTDFSLKSQLEHLRRELLGQHLV